MAYSRCPDCREFVETAPEIRGTDTLYKGYCLYCRKPVEAYSSIKDPSVTVHTGLNQHLRGR